MVDQAQVLLRQGLRRQLRVDLQAGEGKLPSELPPLDGRLNFSSPHKVDLVRGRGPLLDGWSNVVRATNLVLRAVAAERRATELERIYQQQSRGK